jgi:aspartate racemase
MSLKIGLIGGVGWPATIAYYDAICRAARKDGETGSPEMTIESLDMARALAALGQPGDDASWDAFDRMFQDALDSLEAANCDFAAIASVTPHIRLDAITEGSRLPIVSIMDAVAANLLGHPATQVVVLGTKPTMEGTLFDGMLQGLGKTVRRANNAEATAFTDLLETYFYAGRAEAGRDALITYVKSTFGEAGDLMCVLACTDLAPAFPDTAGQTAFNVDGIHFLDATAAHVAAILEAAA